MLLFILGFILLFAFIFVIKKVYKLVEPFRYRAAIRTWLVIFCMELLVLALLPQHALRLPYLPMAYNYGGISYFIIFITDWPNLLPELFRGQRPEEALLLLLPLIPALLVFFYTLYTHRNSPPVSPSSKPGPDAP